MHEKFRSKNKRIETQTTRLFSWGSGGGLRRFSADDAPRNLQKAAFCQNTGELWCLPDLGSDGTPRSRFRMHLPVGLGAVQTCQSAEAHVAAESREFLRCGWLCKNSRDPAKSELIDAIGKLIARAPEGLAALGVKGLRREMMRRAKKTASGNVDRQRVGEGAACAHSIFKAFQQGGSAVIERYPTRKQMQKLSRRILSGDEIQFLEAREILRGPSYFRFFEKGHRRGENVTRRWASLMPAGT
jgi:hypothetical protein